MPAARVAQIVRETLVLPTSGVQVTQRVVEVLITYATPSPTTPTGAGVSQRVVEVLYQDTAPMARVSQRVVELLFSIAATGEGGAVGGGSDTKSYGYAV